MTEPTTWRKHTTHAAETVAVRKALAAAGIDARVSHGTGTAWAWLEINVGAGQQWGDHAGASGEPCLAECRRCANLRTMKSRTLEIARTITGRTGAYDGEITVRTQDHWNERDGRSEPIEHPRWIDVAAPATFEIDGKAYRTDGATLHVLRTAVPRARQSGDVSAVAAVMELGLASARIQPIDPPDYDPTEALADILRECFHERRQTAVDALHALAGWLAAGSAFPDVCYAVEDWSDRPCACPACHELARDGHGLEARDMLDDFAPEFCAECESQGCTTDSPCCT